MTMRSLRIGGFMPPGGRYEDRDEAEVEQTMRDLGVIPALLRRERSHIVVTHPPVDGWVRARFEPDEPGLWLFPG